MELIDYLDSGADIAGDGPCIVEQDGRIYSYPEAQEFTHRVAAALDRDGFAAGDRITVLAPNRGDAFLVLLGGLRAQLAWFPVNPRYSLSNIIALLAQFRCDVLVVDGALLSSVPEIRSGVPSLRAIVSLDEGDGQIPTLASWLAPPGAMFRPPPRGNEEVAAVIPTGGTTGASKGVLQTNRAFEAYAMQHMLAMPLDEAPRFLAATPMTHAAGAMCFPMLARGGTVFVLNSAKPRDIATALTRHAITDIFLPPTVIYTMLADSEVRAMRFPALRYLLYGAAPMSCTKLGEALEWLGPVMAQGFGQTEAIAICTFMSPRDHFVGGDTAGVIENDARLASCGRASPLTRVAIMDPEGNLLDDFERGEIVVRSSLVMKGYDRDPEATAASQAHGWHHTGDIGYRDSEGYFYIVDRLRDMIISGGLNIYPNEIEQVLWSHPAVKDCAVVGLADEKWGERVTAVVELKEGMATDGEELAQFCRRRLESLKTPKEFHIWAELPRSPIGKVLKRGVRDRLNAEMHQA